MNKRQIKKRVKRAKINKERGLVLSLEDRHYIRNYGKRYYTEKELAYDMKRTAFLQSCHIHVIRFYNGQVNLHFREVCIEIERTIKERIKE